MRCYSDIGSCRCQTSVCSPPISERQHALGMRLILNEMCTLRIQITFAFTHSMLIRILHTQTQLRQAKVTSIVMFRTVHHCIVNDKFGYKYCKESTDHLHFHPIPRHTLDRTICLLHHLQLHFLKIFSVFFSFWWTKHIFIIFVIRKGCYPFAQSNSSALSYLNLLLFHSNSKVLF